MAAPIDAIMRYGMDSIVSGEIIDSKTINTGTVHNVPIANGLISNSILLNGTNGYVSLSNDLDFIHKTGVFTISCFVKSNDFDVVGSIAMILDNTGTSSTKSGFSLFVDNRIPVAKQLRFFLTKGQSGSFIADAISADNTVTDGDWHHYVITGDATTLTVYMDKVAIATTVIGGLGSAQADPLLIGAYVAAPAGFFAGAFNIDELLIYDRELTTQEISDCYNDGLNRIAINGNITSTTAITDWNVRCYRNDTGEKTAETVAQVGAYALSIAANDNVPSTIVAIPEQGDLWFASTVRTIEQLVLATDPSTTPYYYKVMIAGTTGATEPTWVTVPGQTVVDGTVTWECVERLVQPITHSPIIPQ